MQLVTGCRDQGEGYFSEKEAQYHDKVLNVISWWKRMMRWKCKQHNSPLVSWHLYQRCISTVKREVQRRHVLYFSLILFAHKKRKRLYDRIIVLFNSTPTNPNKSFFLKNSIRVVSPISFLRCLGARVQYSMSVRSFEQKRKKGLCKVDSQSFVVK